MDNFFETDSVLTDEQEHIFVLEHVKKDGIYLKIISKLDGVAFTLNLHPALANNELEVVSTDSTSCKILNLYGIQINTDHIGKIIQAEEHNKLGSFEKLQNILDNPRYSKKFEN